MRGSMTSMQLLCATIQDALFANDIGFQTVLVIAESKQGSETTAYWAVTGKGGGSDLAAYAMAQIVPSEIMDTIYPVPVDDDSDDEPDEADVDEDEDEAG